MCWRLIKKKRVSEALSKEAEAGAEDMIAPLPLTVAKSKQTDFLKTVREEVVTLKAICKDPEKQEQDRLSTATARLAETWQKYEARCQGVLGLVTKDQVEDELAIFFELEEFYEAAIDKANKISKRREDSRKEKVKTND